VSSRLESKRCLVTGAASGIGLAVARLFAAHGGRVEGLDLRGDEGAEPPVRAVDVADEAAVGAAVGAAAERLGGLDVLVNSAGVCPPGTVESTDLETWERVFAVNVRGTFLVSRAAIPHMARAGGGSIVNLGSNYGLVGGLNAAAYCGSKGAVVALTRAMALDHADQGIRVNCVCPGTVDTPLIREPMEALSERERKRITESRLSRHPLGRIGQPEDVAFACLYLAGDEAQWVTGSTLPVDGGYTAR
jgi:NAD(P)-dependent dehydrogenase (short-subunit alcohol dehydrogenase family)